MDHIFISLIRHKYLPYTCCTWLVTISETVYNVSFWNQMCVCVSALAFACFEQSHKLNISKQLHKKKNSWLDWCKECWRWLHELCPGYAYKLCECGRLDATEIKFNIEQQYGHFECCFTWHWLHVFLAILPSPNISIDRRLLYWCLYRCEFPNVTAFWILFCEFLHLMNKKFYSDLSRLTDWVL
jgi:hypothetical protein